MDKTELINRLMEFAKLQEDWDSYGAKPISSVALVKVFEVVENINTLPQFVAPIGNGGLQLEWSIQRVGIDVIEVEVEIQPDGDLGYLLQEKATQEFYEKPQVSLNELVQLFQFLRDSCVITLDLVKRSLYQEKKMTNESSNANRVSQEDLDWLMDSAVVDEKTLSEKTLVASYVFPQLGGWSVRGEGSVIDPANFDIEVGRKRAKEEARDKLWEFMAFLKQLEMAGKIKIIGIFDQKDEALKVENPPILTERIRSALDAEDEGATPEQVIPEETVMFIEPQSDTISPVYTYLDEIRNEMNQALPMIAEEKPIEPQPENMDEGMEG